MTEPVMAHATHSVVVEPTGSFVEPTSEGALVVFDGVCNLCSATVRWLIKHDTAQNMRFAASESALGQSLLREIDEKVASLDRNKSPSDSQTLVPQTIVVRFAGRTTTQSGAIIELLRLLPPPWKWLGSGLAVVPRPIRDAAYRVVARFRYSVFGKADQCMVPAETDRWRFVD